MGFDLGKALKKTFEPVAKSLDPGRNGVADSFNPELNGFNAKMDPARNGVADSLNPAKNGFNAAMSKLGNGAVDLLNGLGDALTDSQNAGNEMMPYLLIGGGVLVVVFLMNR
jgi:hypothetical protein